MIAKRLGQFQGFQKWYLMNRLFRGTLWVDDSPNNFIHWASLHKTLVLPWSPINKEKYDNIFYITIYWVTPFFFFPKKRSYSFLIYCRVITTLQDKYYTFHVTQKLNNLFISLESEKWVILVCLGKKKLVQRL